jgi:hypothetical protein
MTHYGVPSSYGNVFATPSHANVALHDQANADMPPLEHPASLNQTQLGPGDTLAQLTSTYDFMNAIAEFLGLLPQTSMSVYRNPTLPPFDAAAYVNSLEEVDMSTIAPEDNKCPHCWLPFGTTCEDEPGYVPGVESDPEVEECLAIGRELPFCATRPNNDPVRTWCGHIFGRGCLLESLEKTNRRCPMCRQDLV